MAVIEQIRYEMVHTFQRDEVFNEDLGRYTPTGLLFVNFDQPRDLDVRKGDTITLETSKPEMNGPYKVESIVDNERGYKRLTVRIAEAGVSKGGLPLWFRLLDMPSTSGKIYFGKRNVVTTAGGWATQILNNDFKTALLGLAALAIVVGAAYQFFGPNPEK